MIQDKSSAFRDTEERIFGDVGLDAKIAFEEFRKMVKLHRHRTG